MFEIHFGLRENPFVSGHQPRFVFPSPEHQEALAHLRFGIENREPFVLITGEVGTGKTTALYDVLIEWKGRVHVALINNSALTRSELPEEICLRLRFTPPASCGGFQELSPGIRRETNHIWKEWGRGASVDDARFGPPEHVQAAAGESGFKRVIGGGAAPPETTAPPVPPPRSTPRE